MRVWRDGHIDTRFALLGDRRRWCIESIFSSGIKIESIITKNGKNID